MKVAYFQLDFIKKFQNYESKGNSPKSLKAWLSNEVYQEDGFFSLN